MIDIHCHILPGIDDGPRNWQQSLDLCRAMAEDGIRTAVATPHLIDGIYNNTRSRVEPLARELRQRVSDAGIHIEILAGAEVDIACQYITNITDELPLLGGGRSVLLEMPVAVVPHTMAQILFGARMQEIVPILAHPERNELVQDNIELAREWIDAGAAIQIDGDSLLGVWGRRSKRCAEQLLRKGLCHAMASDAHSCDKRPPRLAESVKAAEWVIGSAAAKLVNEGPRMLLEGQCPPTPMYSLDESRQRRSPSQQKSRRPLMQRMFRRR